jgi:hypothetical protein
MTALHCPRFHLTGDPAGRHDAVTNPCHTS